MGDPLKEPIRVLRVALGGDRLAQAGQVSDGFYTYADERKIAALVRDLGPDIDALTISRHLVEYARNEGGTDNITVVAVVF